MELPNLGQPQNQNYYSTTVEPASRKKLILIVGGVLVLVIALILVLTSGGSKAGQETMRSSLQASSEALGIIDEYEDRLQYAPSKNDVALVQILLRGNFQKLNELYTTTYKPKNKISNSPKVDSESKETLDRSVRDNTLDSDILKALEPKIAEAKKSLTRTRPSFTKKDSVEKIETSIKDLESIEDILARDR